MILRENIPAGQAVPRSHFISNPDPLPLTEMVVSERSEMDLPPPLLIVFSRLYIVKRTAFPLVLARYERLAMANASFLLLELTPDDENRWWRVFRLSTMMTPDKALKSPESSVSMLDPGSGTKTCIDLAALRERPDRISSEFDE